ncbi:ATP-dependent DNA ligase [Lacisediminihabitans changchengi]|uniref:DNA ligase (ATP) n=1 Tax=Lacisediminihabitans changchengi TaxID=2787634 RepID=A0A934SJE8_9MICO|nr:ATP-dependent DNA ligase [Lacisediminihabitans changchengi]MBK4346678.1 ATP-dependent DNA ligase [Lacisediminihabitans changchengi]
MPATRSSSRSSSARSSGARSSGGSGETVSVEGHRLKLTNLDKVLYPETGTTKADVLSYYAEIASVLIPHASNRPATRKRWVHGVGTPEHPGEVFFQKNLEDSAPTWVKRRTIEHKDHENLYPLVNDLATLTWLAQIAALEIHVPQWRFGRTGTRRNPDRLVLDLDPGDGAGLLECAEVARLVRDILSDMGLTAMPVTSGSKGIHLYAALDGSQNSDQVSAVAHELARALEADHPDLVVSDMKKTLRTGKVLLDWSQNNGSKTTIAPYSLRGRFTPTVAAPRTWRELASKNLDQLDYEEVLRRVKRRGDPLADLASGHLNSLEPTPAHLAAFERTDRLATYRGKRSADRTPEPVPAGPAETSDGRSFVIQEHHARRLHFDFRLEHDGVLVSWAVPKNVPTEPKQNHLAVHTEDHPLEYGSFEGTIPAGEYGGGTVSIWDAGTYDLEKWRDGEEVIVTLNGRADGGLGGIPRRVALIHTGHGGAKHGGGKDDQNWLMHLMKEQPRAAAADPMPPPKAMLASAGSTTDIRTEADWAFEMKWDGIRAIVTAGPDGVTLTSRNGNDMTRTYPELAAVTAAVGGHSATLDGEIVALDRSGRPDFGVLQSRMNVTDAREIERLRASTPVKLMLFDLLLLDGESLLKRDYDSRRTALTDLVRDRERGVVQVPPAFDGDLDDAMATSLELGLEGVVAKERSEPYSAGRRSPAWIKLKHHRTQEVVIGGWRPGNGRRADGVGSVLLGIPDDHGIRYVGRVGTGFSDRALDELAAVFAHRARATSPLYDVPTADAKDANWVRADLVAEVQFAEWTSTGRLRQPTWRGFRPDKSPADVVPE